MTQHLKPNERPEFSYDGFDHISYYVSNAKSAAAYYILRFGFQPFAYKGLETGSRDIGTHVVKQGKVVLSFSNSLSPETSEISQEVGVCGDFVKDVAFTCDDAIGIYNKAIARGAKSYKKPEELKDEFGTVITATIHTYGKTLHTFVQRTGYDKDHFMPGFKMVTKVDPLSSLIPSPNVDFIDHVVGNLPDGMMEERANWYRDVLDFHRFWTVDDTQVLTEYSALRSTVMADFDRVIKMPINEPAEGKKKSQIQEYVEYHGGAGVQHVALNVKDLIYTVKNLKSRGVDFLTIPSSYYTDLKLRLSKSEVKVAEDLAIIEELNILVDFDDKGYLLQLFTKPLEDRPTLFYEFIQRENHDGFGAGNFKSLFESIEREQANRGNLN